MKIKVLLFGVLAEKAGKQELELENINSLDKLKDHLNAEFRSFEDTKYNMSVNKTLVHGDMNLKDGDEVALLPPFAGG